MNMTITALLLQLIPDKHLTLKINNCPQQSDKCL